MPADAEPVRDAAIGDTRSGPGMTTTKPRDAETVWIEYPEGKHFEAVYDAAADTFTPAHGPAIGAAQVANWSRDEHEDTDISDDLQGSLKGGLTRS